MVLAISITPTTKSKDSHCLSDSEHQESAEAIKAAVKNVLNDTNTPADISLEELLNNTNVFHNM